MWNGTLNRWKSDAENLQTKWEFQLSPISRSLWNYYQVPLFLSTPHSRSSRSHTILTLKQNKKNVPILHRSNKGGKMWKIPSSDRHSFFYSPPGASVFKKTKTQRSVFFNDARERLWMKLRCWLFPSLRRCQVGVPTCSTHDQLAPFFLIRPLVRLTPPFVLPFSFSPGPTSSGLFSPLNNSFFFFFSSPRLSTASFSIFSPPHSSHHFFFNCVSLRLFCFLLIRL